MDFWLIILIGSVIFLGLVWGFLYQMSRHPEWPRRAQRARPRPDRAAAQGRDG